MVTKAPFSPESVHVRELGVGRVGEGGVGGGRREGGGGGGQRERGGGEMGLKPG